MSSFKCFDPPGMLPLEKEGETNPWERLHRISTEGPPPRQNTKFVQNLLKNVIIQQCSRLKLQKFSEQCDGKAGDKSKHIKLSALSTLCTHPNPIPASSTFGKCPTRQKRCPMDGRQKSVLQQVELFIFHVLAMARCPY